MSTRKRSVPPVAAPTLTQPGVGTAPSTQVRAKTRRGPAAPSIVFPSPPRPPSPSAKK